MLRSQGVEVALVPVATAAEEVASPGDSPSGSGPPPRLELARLELADSRLRWLSGEGARLEAGLDLEADRLAWPPPEGRRAVEALRGTANVEVTRKAVQARIELEGALDGSRIELSRLGLGGAGHELGLEGRGLASLGEEVLTIERLALRGPRAELDVSGALGWQGFRGLELRGRGLRVEPLASLADLPFGMGGQLDVAMQLRGALAAPELDARLDWRDARVGAMRGFRVQGEARSDAERLQIELHTERDGRPAGGISASLPFAFDVATLAADPSARVELRSEAFDLGLLEPLLPPGVSDPEGTARIDLSLRGGSPPALAGRLDLEDGSVRVPALDEEQPLAPLALHLALSPEGEGVRLDALDVRTPLGVAEGRGVLHPAAGNDLELTVSELEMGTLAGLLGLGWELGGQVGGRLRVEGALAAPTLEGRVHWEAPRMGLASGERVELEVEADGRQARAEAWVIESGREAVRATARGPVATLLAGRLGPGVEIRVQGDDFQLETLAPILPRRLREVSGRADVALEVRGGARPELHGSVELSDGALRVPLLSHTFAPITGRVRFDRSRIEPLLEVGTPGASGRLSGVLELGEAAEGTLVAALRPQRADLALELEHLPVARSRVLSADAHGSARVVGALDALSLTGEVVLENARLRLPEAEDPILREVRIVASQPRGGLGEVSTGPGVFERSEVQLKVALPRDSWLRGRGIELELAGDVEVRKRPLQATRFSGGVRVLRGRYLLYGRRFDVRAGRATLTGSERFDPRVEVEAHHRVRDVTVIARLTGPISSPQLQLLGDPPMSETDVLSYLMTGCEAEDSDSRGGGFDAAAAQLAAGVAANEALAVLPGGEWVDSVDFRMGEGGSPEEVGVGRYMTRDLFVRYGRGFGEDAHDRIGIELRLSDEWSLESDLATDESAGADLIWSRDF